MKEQFTPNVRERLHHLCETARQVCARAAVLHKQSKFYVGDDRLHIERRILRKRALRLERFAVELASDVESIILAHKKTQFKVALMMARAEARLQRMKETQQEVVYGI